LPGHGDQFDAHPNPQPGNMNGWVDDDDDDVEETLGKVVEKLKVLENEENATLRKKLVENEGSERPRKTSRKSDGDEGPSDPRGPPK
nr:hypothetical protein [Tanacetum cinerariifolium]